MAKKAPVVKVLAWRNTSPILERWDIEVARADGTRERVVGVSPVAVSRMLAIAESEVTRGGKTAAPRRVVPKLVGKRGRPISEILALGDIARAAWERKMASGTIRIVRPKS